MVVAEHNNRLPPVADKRRVLWRRGQRKFALQANIFFGHRKSRECSPKIFDFRANGIPVGERVDFFDTLRISPVFVCNSEFFKKRQLCIAALDYFFRKHLFKHFLALFKLGGAGHIKIIKLIEAFHLPFGYFLIPGQIQLACMQFFPSLSS